MKNSKKILFVAMSIIMIIATIIPIFAVTASTYLSTEPVDIGTLIGTFARPTANNNIEKYYCYIDLAYLRENNTNYTIYQIVNNDNNTTLGNVIGITINLTNEMLSITGNNYYSNYSITVYPTINIDITDKNDIWIPCFALYGGLYATDNNLVKIYKSTTTDYNTIMTQYYQMGHTDGYNEGYIAGVVDSSDIQHNLNLVEHCEQLLGTFVGEDYAHYITPLCLVLVVILIYFLFIRWLLALIKSKNVTRVADIIVCTACILMLVIMYAPMLDLTTNVNQYNHQVYEIATDTTAQIVRNSNITVIPTETGTILDGPVGRVVIPLETVYKNAVDTVYKIVDDVVVGG